MQLFARYQRNEKALVLALMEMGDVREIFAATTREQAMTTAEAVASRWDMSHPVVARLIEEGGEDCLACLAFPLAHRSRIRTTNGTERLSEEIKRRTRVVRIFPNPAACLRLVTALCVEQSEEWVSGRRYLEMSELCPSIATEEGFGDYVRDYPPEWYLRPPW